ncbi:hypothetical protein GL4_1514 [Methyloceanibacter caenitepidi]|uniref:Uncharacterized protein n=1 Tax=Methyloceanibacter caenitepidi TaxID=1384459 RepID=A0A0A8K241_9HYPH|nr:hypothetical protein GL4_1514 [Methyloceanibacter caenitepidi]
MIRLHGPAYTPLLARALAEKEKADRQEALVARALRISQGGEIGGLEGQR